MFVNYRSVWPSPVAIPTSSFIHVQVTASGKKTFFEKKHSFEKIGSAKSTGSVFKDSLHESLYLSVAKIRYLKKLKETP